MSASKKHLIIDGDPFIYEVGFACTTVVEIDGDIMSTSNQEEAAAMMDSLIRDALVGTKCSTYTVALSDLTQNWRKPLYPNYKAQRKASKRPGCFGFLRSHLSKVHKAIWWNKCEADDVCGVLLTEYARRFPSKTAVLCSIDKDMLTIPGKHFNPSHPDRGIQDVSNDQAWRNHLRQTLTGDRTDNYPGCPGVGPVGADRLLDLCLTPTEAWAAVVRAFEKAGQTPADALVNARIAHILQDGEYNRNTGEVTLWSPPQSLAA